MKPVNILSLFDGMACGMLAMMKADISVDDYFKKIKTFDEMVAFQKAKKYKFAWVLHKCIEQGIEIPEKYNYMRRIMNI